jgi:hypothetical protein
VKIVAAVLGGVEGVEARVPREPNGVPNASRETVGNVMGLMKACGIVAPNPSSRIELGTRVESAS